MLQCQSSLSNTTYTEHRAPFRPFEAPLQSCHGLHKPMIYVQTILTRVSPTRALFQLHRLDTVYAASIFSATWDLRASPKCSSPSLNWLGPVFPVCSTGVWHASALPPQKNKTMKKNKTNTWSPRRRPLIRAWDAEYVQTGGALPSTETADPDFPRMLPPKFSPIIPRASDILRTSSVLRHPLAVGFRGIS